MDKRRVWLIAGAVAIAAVFVWQGIATFDQWSAFVAGLLA